MIVVEKAWTPLEAALSSSEATGWLAGLATMLSNTAQIELRATSKVILTGVQLHIITYYFTQSCSYKALNKS